MLDVNKQENGSGRAGEIAQHLWVLAVKAENPSLFSEPTYPMVQGKKHLL